MTGDIITYDYYGSLYINLTNRCDCRCVFCIRDQADSSLGGLWLQEEPKKEDVLAEILGQDLTQYAEIVFCGYGEPTCRLDAVSVSLNASNAADYLAITRPGAGEAAWQAMLDFVRDAQNYVPKVMVSIVDYDKTPQEIAACRHLAESLGAIFRVRPFAG